MTAPPPPVTSVAPELLRHHDAMRRLATRLVVAEDVDDVVQETMVRALEHPPRGDLGAWLGSVLRNVVRFRRRSDSRRRQRETVAAQRTATPTPRGATSDTDLREPADALEQMEAAERVSRALRGLKEPYRTVLVQRYFLQRRLADIAKDLGVREETVRQRHKRGLDMMRIALAKTGKDGAPALTRARLALVFAPWLSPSTPLAAATTTASAALAKTSLIGALTTFLLSVTMKAKVALGIAAVVALAGISAYALWDPTGGTAPTPSDGQPANQESADLESPQGKGDSKLETNRTEIPDAARDPKAPLATGLGIDIRMVWDDDGAPVADTKVFLTEASRWTSATQPDHDEATDNDGIARFRGLEEGRYLVDGRFRRRKSTPLIVEVNTTSLDGDPFEVRILRGTTVTGRVLDPDGNGIAGASVLRAGWASSWTQEISVTDADGRFEVDGLHGRISMGARAAGFVPSLMRGVNLNEKKTDSIEITLRPAAATLIVKVTDPTGAPVVGARAGVGVFGRQSQPKRGPDGRHEHIMPNHAKTDDAGVANLGGLAPGTWSVEVSAKSLSGYAGEVEIPSLPTGVEAPTIVREIQLPELIVIEGHARDGDGLPLENVYVGYGRHGHLVHSGTSTEADGSYRLTGAPSGVVKMHAQRKGLDRRETIETLPGRTHTWDVAFVAERKVRGTIRWDDGTVVPHAGISAWETAPGRRWHSSEHVDESGAFVLELPKNVTALRVQVRTLGGFYQVVHEGPLPEGSFDIVLGPEHKPSATLRGRIVNPDGKALGGADLWHALVGQGNASPIEVDAEGRFEHAVTPGAYNLTIEVAGFAGAVRKVEVGSDEERDLGDIVLEHPAALRVKVDGAPDGELTFWLTNQESKRRRRLEIVNGEGSIGGLTGGTYRVQVCGHHFASESHEVFLKAAPGGGEPTEVRFTARPATPLALTVTAAAGAKTPRAVDFEIIDGTGQVVVRHRGSISSKGALYTKFALAPGRYQVRASEGELSGLLAIEVAAVSTDPYPVNLVLR